MQTHNCETQTETIRYLSLYDNSYLRYFKGHRDRVLSISMCPAADTFISSSLDATVRLWDLRQNACQGLIHMPRVSAAVAGAPWSLAAYDPTGTVFAVAAPHTTPHNAEVKLFDAAHFERGPFCEAVVPGVDGAVSLRFSPDGRRLMLLTTGPKIVLLDVKPSTDKAIAVSVCFSFLSNRSTLQQTTTKQQPNNSKRLEASTTRSRAPSRRASRQTAAT